MHARIGRTAMVGVLIFGLSSVGLAAASSSFAAGLTPTKTTPADGASTNMASTVVSATYTETLDTTPGVGSSISLSKAGGAVSGATTFTADHHTIIFTPSSSLTNGSYTATSDAVDTSLPRQSGTSSWTFTIDTAPPPQPRLNPLPWINSTNLTHFLISGTEDEQTAQVQVTLTTSSGAPVTVAATRSGGRFSATVDASSLPDGPVSVEVVATDEAGNASTALAWPNKDVVAPQETSTSPADGATAGTVKTISATWDEDPPKQATMEVTDSSGAVQAGELSTERRTVSLNLDRLPDQARNPYTATATASDRAGNIGRVTFGFNVQPPGTGTVVCGPIPHGTTTWSAAGEPFLICPQGVSVPTGAELVLDGSQGSFAVLATGSAGLDVTGYLHTLNTSATNVVTFDAVGSAPTPGQWAGLSGEPNYQMQSPFDPFPSIELSHAIVRHAVIGVHVTGMGSTNYLDLNTPRQYLVLKQVEVNSSSQQGVYVQSAAATLSQVQVNAAGADGIQVDCRRSSDPTNGGYNAGQTRAPVTVSASHVDAAVRIGLDVLWCPSPTVTDNTVVNSGREVIPQPAMSITSFTALYLTQQPFALGASTGVSGNVGSSNGLDAMAIAGEQQNGFTWLTPTNSDQVHPLGYVNLGLRVMGIGTLDIPAGAVVKTGVEPSGIWTASGYLLIDGPATTVGPGAVLTSTADDSVDPATCASALSTSCTPTDGDWQGLTAATGAVLTGAAIHHAKVAVAVATMGYSSTTGQPIHVDGVTISDCEMGFDVNALTLTNSTISDLHGVADGPLHSGAGVAARGSVTMRHVSISRAGGGVFLQPTGLSGKDRLDIEDVTIDNVGSGYEVSDVGLDLVYDDPIFQNVTVTHARVVGGIEANHLDIGPGRHVSGLRGAGNSDDVVVFTGSVVGDLTWVSGTHSDILAPTGYTGDLTILGGTVTIPADTTVAVHSLDLVGGTLDATAGGAVFEGITPREPSSSESAHGSITLTGKADGQGHHPAVLMHNARWIDGLSGPGGGDGGMIRITDPESTVHIDGSTFTATQGGGASFAGPAVLDNDHLTGFALGMNGGRLTNSTLNGNGQTRGIGAVGDLPVTLDRVSISNSVQPALATEGGSITMTRSSITNTRGNVNTSGSPENFGAVSLGYGGSLTVSCSTIKDNINGIATDKTGTISLTDSDLYGNSGGRQRYDAYSGGGAITNDRTWWGQAGGPSGSQTQGPGTVTTHNPAATQEPHTTISVSSDNTRPDGSYGPGTLTVQLPFTRTMDTTVQPTVTLTGQDGQPHTIHGSWDNDHQWTGHYTISSSSADSGSNRIDASAANSCIPDPATNQMAPASTTVAIASTPGAAISSGPNNGGYSNNTARFTFSSDQIDATFSCTLDGHTSPCTSPATYTALAGGQHTFRVNASNNVGSGAPSARSWTADTAPPEITLTAPTVAFQLAGTVPVTWHATDSSSGMRDVTVRYRKAGWNQRLSRYTTPTSWTHITHPFSTAIAPGSTLCISAEARDRVGNSSAWAAERCITRPLDDRALTASTGWARTSSSTAYNSTITRSTISGSLLTLRGATTTRLALVTTRCPSCGIVAVIVNGRVFGNINLRAATTQHAAIIVLPTMPLAHGTIQLRVVGSSRSVEIDGIGLAAG